MKIILMRHGDAVTYFIDETRPLSEKGALEADAAGKFLRSIDEIPDIIVHSPLLRSRETAERVEKAVGAAGLLKQHERLNPDDDPIKFRIGALMQLAEKKSADYTIMVVGHEPFTSALASILLWDTRRDLAFNTGTLLGAKSFSPEKTWDLCFFVHADYLIRLFS